MSVRRSAEHPVRRALESRGRRPAQALSSWRAPRPCCSSRPCWLHWPQAPRSAEQARAQEATQSLRHEPVCGGTYRGRRSPLEWRNMVVKDGRLYRRGRLSPAKVGANRRIRAVPRQCWQPGLPQQPDRRPRRWRESGPARSPHAALLASRSC